MERARDSYNIILLLLLLFFFAFFFPSDRERARARGMGEVASEINIHTHSFALLTPPKKFVFVIHLASLSPSLLSCRILAEKCDMRRFLVHLLDGWARTAIAARWWCTRTAHAAHVRHTSTGHTTTATRGVHLLDDRIAETPC